jgi:cobalt-zinc-cadmium efflux system protein
MSHPHHHAHNHGHDHAHGHAHSHGSAQTNFGTAFAVATALNILIVLLQAGYGFAANSMALLTDAAHNFGDVLGLVIAWVAHVLAQRAPAGRYTYGYRSATILAVLANGVILLAATGGIVWEAIQRIGEPVQVGGVTVMIVAAAGIAVNGISAWILMAGSRNDLNMRGAFLHMIADAAISVGVVIAGAVILLTGWNLIDPIISLVISGVIVWGTWGLLRDSITLSLKAVPPQIDLENVRDYLCALPNVKEVHDLHVWAISTTDTALTCHLVMPDGHPGDAFIESIAHDLHHNFQIAHPTIQIELADAGTCRLASVHVI